MSFWVNALSRCQDLISDFRAPFLGLHNWTRLICHVVSEIFKYLLYWSDKIFDFDDWLHTRLCQGQWIITEQLASCSLSIPLDFKWTLFVWSIDPWDFLCLFHTCCYFKRVFHFCLAVAMMPALARGVRVFLNFGERSHSLFAKAVNDFSRSFRHSKCHMRGGEQLGYVNCEYLLLCTMGKHTSK